jgi:hypothetical protein
MKKRLTGATTPLEKAVQRICNAQAGDYESGVEGFLNDLMTGGCQSGMVGSLIYYRDTLKFYRRHREEIGKLLSEMVADCGDNPLRNWDKSDPLANDTSNQNLLAWFGFEETARNLAGRNGIEL